MKSVFLLAIQHTRSGKCIVAHHAIISWATVFQLKKRSHTRHNTEQNVRCGNLGLRIKFKSVALHFVIAGAR